MSLSVKGLKVQNKGWAFADDPDAPEEEIRIRGSVHSSVHPSVRPLVRVSPERDCCPRNRANLAHICIFAKPTLDTFSHEMQPTSQIPRDEGRDDGDCRD